MNGFPPAVLVETWIFLATNNNPELENSRAPALKKIYRIFGSIEVAILYVEHCSSRK
jgi:hypothetical protein